ncbi:MAG: calcium-binding protein [Pseudomonadota bacterium]
MLALLLPALLIGFGLAALIGDDDDDITPAPGVEEAGGPGDDTLEGGAGDDLLDGRVGADSLSGAGGEDTLIGGSGVDVLDGGAGKDLLEGGNGDDALFGGNGADELRGGNADDALIGGNGNDVLRGNEGDDGLYGSAGSDALFGNEGDDVLYGVDVIDADLLTPEGVLGVVAEETFEEFVDINADPGEADTLNGGDGNDVILAGSGDVVTGGDGLDDIVLGPWVTPDAPVTITDFNPNEDVVIFGHTTNAPPSDVRFVVDENGDLQLVSDNGVLARLPGTAGQMVTPTDTLFFVRIPA